MTKTLFDAPIAHRNDPVTSYEAGQKMIDSDVLQNQEYAVMVGIIAYFSDTTFTAKELANKGITSYYTIQRRLSGLHRKGKIDRTGEKRNGCAVWKLKN
jgi:predicted HTH transcriptional regulator